MRRMLVAIVAVLTAIALEGEAVGASRSHLRRPATTPAGTRGVAPGAPGATADWAPADKHGFGTSNTTASKVWFTLEDGELSEVYYPRLDTPSYRDLQFVVTDGHSFAEREQDSTVQRTIVPDPRSLSSRQVNTDRQHRWRLTKTYVTDPRRSTVAIHVQFQSLTGRPYQLYVLADPSLSNNGDDDSGNCSDSALVAHDAQTAAALVTRPALTAASCGFKGVSDGWTDLSAHKRMRWHYASAPNGNVVETGRTALNGKRGHQRLTLALGFGGGANSAISAARGSLSDGFGTLATRYARGWHDYVSSLKAPPSSLTTAAERREYTISAMVLAASEDKTFRGAFVASPSMPWAWGTGLSTPSDAYHLVWSRDLYEIATALIADGDVAGAQRALHFLLDRQQKPDGSFPQNSDVTGTPKWTNLQLDEVADPIILAHQLGDTGAATWSHVKRAADFIVNFDDGQGHSAPYTPQERWENQSGYSPATIAAEIAGLVCAADISSHNGDSASAQRYLATADDWQSKLNSWTLTTNGPYSPKPYYLRLTKDGNPDAGTTYSVGDSGPAAIDQRRVVDPSFLEMVRLGVKSPDDPKILNTIKVVDQQLSTVTPNGRFWHRYTGDGYGEQRNGGPWEINQPPGSQTTIGRVWPIFAGERGEYELAAGHGAAQQLASIAATANDGGMLPEQVWDQNPPSGTRGFAPGTPTFSATPLAWTHAQFIRLAWSIQAGHPVEQPAIVACRYTRKCS
ncbi:MAG: glycoside hydrolase family 15 protein [Solirubrobacteraceae bacterium]